MVSPVPRSPLVPLTALCALLLGGCQNWLEAPASASLPPTSGVQPVQGLAQSASIRRNPQGMPLIETSTFHDALFALGYVHAGDRLEQMLRLRLLAAGRLAEMEGPQALPLDRLMRAAELRREAEGLYRSSSPRLKKFFEVYARGVNAYLFQYRDRLPANLARPAYWQPEDSVLLFCLLNFGQTLNLQGELGALILAQRVGSTDLPWLLPIAADEPLPFAEAEKLAGLDLGQFADLTELARAAAQSNPLGGSGSQWAIAPPRSRSGKSLLAGDFQQAPIFPSAWSFVQIRAPRYQVAGAGIAGLPLLLAGYNGKLAWHPSMLMADGQDLFIERLESRNGRLHYLADGQWRPALERQETFFVKGQRPLRETVYATANGPLLGNRAGLGLALRRATSSEERSLDAFFDLSRADSVEQALEISREIRASALNLLFADAGHIGWQVSGRYPNRRDGIGLLPSPGWDGRYAWDGFADPMLHPYDQDPPQGWLGSANQRVVPAGYGMQLSSAWQAPERAERLAQLAAGGQHDSRSMMAMQQDQTSTFVAKLQAMFDAPGMAQPLRQAIDALPPAERARASEAHERLLAFDGRLAASSADAALYAAFLHASARQIFLDELGPEHGPAWNAFLDRAEQSYSALADHLLGREDSPFWNDRATPHKEDKATILARSLAAAVTLLEQRLGSDRRAWQWGRLHELSWSGGATRFGPYPLGGDHDTLNNAAYRRGQDFTVRRLSSLRMIVDFGQDEPLALSNTPGQSGNPASPHYADGLEAWRQGEYLGIPFQSQNLNRGYGDKRLTLVPK